MRRSRWRACPPYRPPVSLGGCARRRRRRLDRGQERPLHRRLERERADDETAGVAVRAGAERDVGALLVGEDRSQPAAQHHPGQGREQHARARPGVLGGAALDPSGERVDGRARRDLYRPARGRRGRRSRDAQSVPDRVLVVHRHGARAEHRPRSAALVPPRLHRGPEQHHRSRRSRSVRRADSIGAADPARAAAAAPAEAADDHPRVAGGKGGRQARGLRCRVLGVRALPHVW